MSPDSEAYVLDASALLALLLGERGHEKVESALDGAFMHSVNLVEVIGKLARIGVAAEEVGRMIERIGLEILEEFSILQAQLSGELLATTREQGLSLGDCVCLAVAACAGACALTADQRWCELHGRPLGEGQIRVEVIR